jgi:hypothetical protein
MEKDRTNISERGLAFGNMTLTPRDMDKLPYHAPVTNGEIHPHSNGNKKKKKRMKSKSKSTKLNELREAIRKIIAEIGTESRRMKELWYVKRTSGGVMNISASKGEAEDFLWDKLKGDGEVFYVEVPLEDWESEKVGVSNISDYAKRLYREGVSLYSDEPKTVWAFIRGDEVYRVGNTEPLGMVVSLGDRNVMVKRHEDGKVVAMDPNNLYLGKDWHRYNKQANS